MTCTVVYIFQNDKYEKNVWNLLDGTVWHNYVCRFQMKNLRINYVFLMHRI